MTPRRKPRIMWHSTLPSPAARQMVAEELRDLLEHDLGRPSQLCFHTVILTDDFDGPSVFVWGEKFSPVFHAQFHQKTAWKSLDGGSEW